MQQRKAHKESEQVSALTGQDAWVRDLQDGDRRERESPADDRDEVGAGGDGVAEDICPYVLEVELTAAKIVSRLDERPFS